MASTANPASEHDVFISFASEDRDIANEVASRLRRDGISVWRFDDTPGSGSWHLNQLRALRDSKLAIFVITPNSDASTACLDEAQRAADPAQLATVPVPLVVGAWDHVSSDLWLLLSKWNGVIASPRLGDEALHRLTGIVHDKLGFRPVAALSTGQALVAVKEDLCAFIEEHRDGLEDAAILTRAHELQVEHRGNMVAFAQFTYLDRELKAARLIADESDRTMYIGRYLRAFFDRTVAEAHSDVATRLANQLRLGDTVVLSEYSRVIRQAFKILAETDRRLFQSLRILVINRAGMMLVGDEINRMLDELLEMGANPESVAFGDWIDYLLGAADTGHIIGEVDTILFGVEAFSTTGEVVYPQIVKELDALRERRDRTRQTPGMRVVAAGESYKVCRSHAEVSKMIADPHYTVLPSSVIDMIVTDIGEFVSPRPAGAIDLNACVRSTERKADRIREQLWPETEPLPVWNSSDDKLRAAKVLAADIDGTLTTGGVISVETLTWISALRTAGCHVVLVTGRSAGWAAGLAQYLPEVAGVIAENGAVLLDQNESEVQPMFLDDNTPDTGKIQAALDAALERHRGLRSGSDNAFRLTDRTVEVSSDVDPAATADLAAEFDLAHTYSTVHHHFSCSRLNKQTGLLAALPRLNIGVVDAKTEVLTIGDSVNDRLLFDLTAFADTFGVRDVLTYLDDLGELRPRLVTLASEGEGFNELAARIVSARTEQRDA